MQYHAIFKFEIVFSLCNEWHLLLAVFLQNSAWNHQQPVFFKKAKALIADWLALLRCAYSHFLLFLFMHLLIWKYMDFLTILIYL